MKWTKQTIFRFFLAIILMGLFPKATVAAAETAAQETPADDDLQAQIKPDIAMGFETYQRNVDDLFDIALMTKRDPDFNINSLIVELNRRLVENPEDTSSLVALGHLYRRLGQPREANLFYQKALIQNPDQFHLHVFSGMMEAQIKNVQEALAKFDQALELNPYDADVLAARGKALLQLKRDAEAIQSFEKALEINPDQEEALFILSILYQKHGRGDDAVRLLEALAKRAPDSDFVQYHLGALFLAQGKSEKTIEIWEKLFLKGIRAPQFLFNLAVSYIESQNYGKAQKILSHLRFFFPEEYDLDFLMAETYRQMGRYEEAESKYREVIVLQPSYVSAYIGLARALEEQGKLNDAEEVLQQAARYVTTEEDTVNLAKTRENFAKDRLVAELER